MTGGPGRGLRILPPADDPPAPARPSLRPPPALTSAPMRILVLLAPLALAACVGYATPEREVLWTPLGTYTRESPPAAP